MAPDAGPVLITPRLRLRPWREADLEPFAALSADAEVMAHFPGVLDRAQSDALAHRFAAAMRRDGFGQWAVEVPGEAPFVGFCGLAVAAFTAPFTPCVEIGWRLARAAWGRGYATEAARAVLAQAFGPMDLEALVAFTAVGNQRSRRVMERLGMQRSPADDFAHPELPEGHRLRPHVLYRLSRQRWATLAEVGS